MDNIVLALDQSTQVTGLAIYVNGQLESWEHISPNGEMFERIIKLKSSLKEKITELLFRGKLNVAIEEIQLQNIPGSSRDTNVATFKKLAYVQALLLELCAEMSVPCEIVPSSTWKSALGIKGRNRTEQKRDAQRYVQEEFGVKVIQDECDAICIGKYLVSRAN